MRVTRAALHASIDEAARIVPYRYGCQLSPQLVADAHALADEISVLCTCWQLDTGGETVRCIAGNLRHLAGRETVENALRESAWAIYGQSIRTRRSHEAMFGAVWATVMHRLLADSDYEDETFGVLEIV